ncbi:MAG: TRM11 family SAM-dependent methyltransferase [Promethearchaeota archaeon]
MGKNWRLALAEIDTFLQLPAYSGNILDYSANSAIVEFNRDNISDEFIGDLMVRLGSVQKIGRMLDFLDRETFENAFPVDIEGSFNRAMVYAGRRYLDKSLSEVMFELFPKIKNQKFFVATSIYPEAFSDPYYKEYLVKYFLHYVNKFFNTHLKEEGAKQAIYYKYPQKNLDSGNLNPIFPHHFFRYRLYEPNRVEILYCLTEEGMYIGKTITVSDSNFQKMMDEERPYTEFKQSIPPKFAKTLTSFLGIQPPLNDKKIYDPFCGTGTLLQFAYMIDFQPIGSDILKKQVEATRNNLQYTASLLEQQIPKKILHKQIFQSDIADVNKRLEDNSIDGIATEPVLLPFYREAPTIREAKQAMDEIVVPLYHNLLKQAFRLLKPNTRIAFVSPVIHTKERQRIGLPIQSFAEELGFKSVQLLKKDRILEKEQPRFNLQRPDIKTLFDTGSKYLSREFFVFVKPKN